MNKTSKIIPILLILISVCAALTIQEDIKQLQKDLSRSYWKKDQKFRFPNHMHHTAGLYESQVHFNVVDKKNKLITALQRRKMALPDENMFVTNFVLYGLLEAQNLGTIKIDQHEFSQSLSALASYRDKNQPFGVPQYNFWPQVPINGSWSAHPTNLFKVISRIFPQLPPKVQIWLINHGLFTIAYARDFLRIFCIPSDSDDSSVNIALLGYLQQLNSSHYEYWRNQNFRLQEYYDRISKYAYRPFDKSPQNITSGYLDPRSYFIIHDFLRKKKEEAFEERKEPSVILPTTWNMGYDEQLEGIAQIPLNMNNVDASVNSNFLFGLLYQVKSQAITLNQQQRQMIRNIAEYLAYVIEDGIVRRPDLVFLYYPSQSDFYWFVARTLSLLERMDLSDPDISFVHLVLAKAMRNVASPRLVINKKQSSTGCFWTQFLGNYAKKDRNEDAIYSTALILNALLDTWGYKDGHTYQYLQDIPPEVKESISQGVKYLRANIGAKESMMGNVFFSGSLKVFSRTNPMFFPANKVEDGKGKPIDPQNVSWKECLKNIDLQLYLMSGYIQDEKFQHMLKLKWWQHDVPIDFAGYNQGRGPLYPYWSSTAITRIMMITALSKYLRATASIV